MVLLSANDQFRCHTVPAEYHGQPKFNGFCFGVNIAKIRPAAFTPGEYLFDPNDLIVGQEDHLMKRMRKAKLAPVVLYCVFLYHFKSVTVSAANIKTTMKKLNVRTRSFTGPMADFQFQDEANRTVTKTIDIREELRWYHPEIEGAAFAEVLPGTPGASKSSGYNASAMAIKACEGGLAFPMAVHWKKLALQPAVTRRTTGDSVTNDLCVYPSFWPNKCSTFQAAPLAQMTIVVAIATSGK
jgi:hypothetical protein